MRSIRPDSIGGRRSSRKRLELAATSVMRFCGSFTATTQSYYDNIVNNRHHRYRRRVTAGKANWR